MVTTLGQLKAKYVGRIVYVPFTMPNGSEKKYYGTVDFDENESKFCIEYEDGDSRYTRISKIKEYTVTLSHFFDIIDETGNSFSEVFPYPEIPDKR
jgi:hypothetical protein